MPPKPNELIPARRGLCGLAIQGLLAVLTYSGVAPMPSAGLTMPHRVGGSTLWCRARLVLIRPAMPAAGMQWLIIDFTEPMATLPSRPWRSPSTLRKAAISVLSPSGIPVPWASTSEMLAGSTPLLS